MAREKRYYWLKLKEDFYDRKEIKIIEDMDNGAEYINFYLKLLLKSIKTEGRLYFRDTIPYSPKMLASITGTNIDTVKVGVDLFLSLALMEKWDDGTLFMVETQNMIGSETKWAKIKREQREKKKKIIEIGQCPKLSKESPIEIDIDKDKEIETHTEIEGDVLFEKWLDEYSSGKKTPPAYKANMRKRIQIGNKDAIKTFLEWKQNYLDNEKKKELERKIKEFDYSSISGAKVNGVVITNVITQAESSYIDLHLEDGSTQTFPKEEVYKWIHQKRKDSV